MDLLGGGKGPLESTCHHDGGPHCGSAPGPPGTGGYPGEGAKHQGEEGEEAGGGHGHTSVHLD